MDYLFEKEIYIFGVKRAGMHAIRIWLSKQIEPKNSLLIFQNNTHLTLTFRRYFHQNKPLIAELNLLNKKQWKKEKFYINLIENADLLDVKRKLENKDYQLNVDKREILSAYNAKKFSKEIHNVIVIRNPYHQLASTIAIHQRHLKEKGVSGWYDRHIVLFHERWIQYAKEFIGITQHLPFKCNIFLINGFPR